MGEIDRSQKKQKIEEPEISDDDIWASDGEEYRPQVADEDFYGQRSSHAENAEIAALRRVHAKQGYLNGLSSAKEDSLQKGFDYGYPDGAALGQEVGRIVGTLHIMASLNNDAGVKGKELLETATKELQIQKVLNRKYFTNDLTLPEGGHVLLNKWNKEVAALLQQQNGTPE